MMTMHNLLWLDDLRNPFLDNEHKVPTDINNKHYNINWVLNYEQFVQWLYKFGLPDAISFDHDLAAEHYTPEFFWDDYEASKKYQAWKSQYYTEPTGLECARFLTYYCRLHDLELPIIHVHSANPVGADQIKELLATFQYERTIAKNIK